MDDKDAFLEKQMGHNFTGQCQTWGKLQSG